MSWTATHIDALPVAVQAGNYVRDLLNIEIGATLNMAFCELHHKPVCSGEQVAQECGKVALQHIPSSVCCALMPSACCLLLEACSLQQKDDQCRQRD